MQDAPAKASDEQEPVEGQIVGTEQTAEQQVTSENALVTTDDASLTERNRRRKAAILRAVGLDRVPEEQRELALAIANRYDLDLMLKHVVLIDGRPYITRDALLWVAHRSGQFDGMALTLPPELRDFPEVGKCWYSETTVWRKDMSHAFTLPGRYPVGGQNKKYGPEMSIKVSESMALRRAFNVSAATVEEQWEGATVESEPVPVRTLAERVAERAQQVTVADGDAGAEAVGSVGAAQPDEPEPADPALQELVDRSAPSVSMGLVDES